MKVTQKDIAERVGSSTSLVSRVLSGQAHKIGVNPKVAVVPVGTLPRSEKKTKRVFDYRES